jgi:Asp-tRNA(Asn)/Glu-tRNA(Gln) amidotransferase A subunit family amidase
VACAVGLAVVCLGASSAAVAAEPVIDPETATVSELQTRMQRGELTSEQLTRIYIDRIAALNSRGPGLNAVRTLSPKALGQARAMDAQRRAGRVRGPLHGIPVLVKDNIDVAGLPTTAGSIALEHSVPDRDASIVARLRAAGAVVLGKTNLSEFAFFTTTNAPSGYSSLGGQVLNAYDADLNPSGSSSGSAAAAAAGLAALTIGTETSGSIISPSAAQGIVGMRPTVGLSSRTGILPISASQDTPGPMARTVADAAVELQAIAGRDKTDPATADQPPVPDYVTGLTADALEGERIGTVASNDPIYQAAVAKVQQLGATTVQITAPANTGRPSILSYEFKRDLNSYLSRLPGSAPMKSLADIIAYNDAHPQEALKYGQNLLSDSQAIDLDDPATKAAYEAARDLGRAEARANIDAALTRGTADPGDDLAAILTPSGTLTVVGARAGYPALTVPAGYTATQRRPVNVTFTGTRFGEAALLAIGYAYEQGSQLRRPPSVIDPSLYRCARTTPPSSFGAHSCAPGIELLDLIGMEPRLDFSLETTSIADLQGRMAAGKLTAETLTRAYLARIARTNAEGPSLNAVRIVNPSALADARALDAERAAGDVRGPMHGIPVLLKDNIDVDGMPTTAGAVALEHSFPGGDSPLAAGLRRAGAVILGKTNLSEFANFYSGNSISGYSGLGGQVLTPVDLDINPSGSSSGSAAAASAGLAAATVGTETSGSIISPSSTHGIVGLRPTVGLVPRTGVVPISATQDTPGPMTQTVYDAAAELGAIAGKDAEDPATADAPDSVPDYVAALSAQALDGTRIGVISSTNETYQAAVATVQRLGATTVQVTPPANTSAGSILEYEFKRDLNAYLARLGAGAPMTSLADVIAFNSANSGEAIKLGMSILVSSDAIDLDDPATRATYEADHARGLAESRGNIDAVLTRGTAEPDDDLAAILTPAGTLTGVGARAGYPALTVPAGYTATTRNPVNVTFLGAAFSEARLLALGYAFEQATRARKAPSESNPASWRCVEGSAFKPRSCAP